MNANKFIQHPLSFILLFGVLFAFITPPFQSPDEPNHFFRAWQVSEGRFFPDKTNARLGGYLPASLCALRDTFAFLRTNQQAHLKAATFFRALKTPLKPENRQFTDFPNTAIYAPTAYLPQAVAIAVLRPLGATPLQLLYAARLANLFVWILLVAAACRMMPFLHDTLLRFAALPAVLCIAASASADVITNGLCWWLAASMVATSTTTRFWKKLLAIVVVAANKIIAVPLVLTGLAVQTDRRKMAILLASGALAAICWAWLVQGWFIYYDVYDPIFRDAQTLNSGVNPARQMAFVLENPLFFLHLLTHSLLQALPSMAAHMVGKFGWEKNYLDTGWLVLLWLMLAASLAAEKNPLHLRQRAVLALVAVLYVSAFALTMYGLWSAVGSNNLDNWQGRYFTPIAPVVMMAFGQRWLEKWETQVSVAAWIILAGSNLAMAAAIWGRYWN